MHGLKVLAVPEVCAELPDHEDELVHLDPADHLHVQEGVLARQNIFTIRTNDTFFFMYCYTALEWGAKNGSFFGEYTTKILFHTPFSSHI